VTESEYIDAIPPCCVLTTLEAHIEVLGLCWSITNGYVQKNPADYCKECEFYREVEK
jgi:hypothetical protein